MGDKLLSSSPEKVHTLATRSLDNLEAMSTAGGKDAIDNVKKSVGFDGNWDSNKVYSYVRKNRVLDNLFSNSEIDKFADTADARVRAQTTNEVSDKLAGMLQESKTMPGLIKTVAGNLAEKVGLKGATPIMQTPEIQAILNKK